MPTNNPDVKAEQECMTAIVDALTKLYKHHYSDNGDSVAEALVKAVIN